MAGLHGAPINATSTPGLKSTQESLRPSYLTDDDFRRGEALTPIERGIGSTTFGDDVRQNPTTRSNVWIDTKYKWPNARIPYVISSLYNNQERAVIAEAIREWQTKTCIRFVPASQTDRDYIELTPNDGTTNYCYSNIGRQGGRQYVKMYSPTCMSVGQYTHELGHAIGFGHEHQRPDRDNYIAIQWQNVNPTYKYAYDKYDSRYFTTLNMPYDYNSIMHYPDYSYSSNGQPTFVPKYSGYNVHSMPVKLTNTDINKVKKYYNC